MFKELDLYQFSFDLPEGLGVIKNHHKIRFHKKDFFTSLEKSSVNIYKQYFCDGSLVIKIKKDKVSGYIKLSKPVPSEKVEMLVKMAIFCDKEVKGIFIKENDHSYLAWHISVHAPKRYWSNILQTQQSDQDSAIRMAQVLKGFYLDKCFHAGAIPSKDGLIEFWDSKRPYGNKDIPCSIAFNLGWDWARVLCWDQNQMPSEAETKAELIHKLVLEELKN